MIFDTLIDLESNGFFSATWLVKNGDRWGFWPDVDGNRSMGGDDTFVVWIGDDEALRKWLHWALMVATTRITVVLDNKIIIEPNDGCEWAIQTRNTGQEMELQHGQHFLSFKIGADAGNFVVFWYPQSLLMVHLVLWGGEEALQVWSEGRNTHYGKGVPGKDWGIAGSSYDVYHVSDEGFVWDCAYICEWCGKPTLRSDYPLCDEDRPRCPLCKRPLRISTKQPVPYYCPDCNAHFTHEHTLPARSRRKDQQ